MIISYQYISIFCCCVLFDFFYQMLFIVILEQHSFFCFFLGITLHVVPTKAYKLFQNHCKP